MIDDALEQTVGFNDTLEVGVNTGKEDDVIVMTEDTVPPSLLLFTDVDASADTDCCVDCVAEVETVRELGTDFDEVRDATLEREDDTVAVDVMSELWEALSDISSLIVTEGDPDVEGDIEAVFIVVTIDVIEVHDVNEESAETVDVVDDDAVCEEKIDAV